MVETSAQQVSRPATALERTTLAPREGTFLEVLAAALRLGVSCFGGPIALSAYFREKYVHGRRWLDETTYAERI
jgi:chromate transporter